MPSKRPMTVSSLRMDGEPRPERMGPLLPGPGSSSGSLTATAAAGARSCRRATARRPAARSRPRATPLRDRAARARRRGSPRSRPTIRSPLRSSRMPASFLPSSIRSFGHLSISACAGHGNVDGFDQARPAASEKSAAAVRRAKLDQRASVEIALGATPIPALASPARLLFERDQPVAFHGARRRQ